MKLKFKIIALAVWALSSVFLESCGMRVSENTSDNQQPESFVQLCQKSLKPNSLPINTGKTITVLLDILDTNDCQKADNKLHTLDKLDLTNKKISDLKPLAGLSNLTELLLENNKIDNIESLSGLNNLTKL